MIIKQAEATLLTKKKFENKNKGNHTKCHHQQIGLKCEKAAKKNKKITSGFIKASLATPKFFHSHPIFNQF